MTYKRRLPMEGVTDWGKLIRELRTEQSRSQREVAQRAGVNRSTLRMIEKRTSPGYGPVNVIEAILKALGHELDAMRVRSIEQVRQEHGLDEPRRPTSPRRHVLPAIEPDQPEAGPQADPVEQWRLDRLASHRARYGD